MIWAVFDWCLCDDGYCTAWENIAIFTSEQTARQEADLRSKRYGGQKGHPERHIQKIKVSTKVSAL